jgi:hypothetical protein
MNFEEHDLRKELARLPVPQAPAGLGTALRVIASREAQRRRERQTWRQRMALVWSRAGFLARTMMKPLAVPAFGGLSTAVMVFSIFVPNLALPRPSADVPTMLATEASVKGLGLAPGAYTGEADLVLDLVIDEQGRMLDYEVVSGHATLQNPGVRRLLENNLLFTSFNPGTSFGQPAPSRIRLSLKTSRIEVRG